MIYMRRFFRLTYLGIVYHVSRLSLYLHIPSIKRRTQPETLCPRLIAEFIHGVSERYFSTSKVLTMNSIWRIANCITLRIFLLVNYFFLPIKHGNSISDCNTSLISKNFLTCMAPLFMQPLSNSIYSRSSLCCPNPFSKS